MCNLLLTRTPVSTTRPLPLRDHNAHQIPQHQRRSQKKQLSSTIRTADSTKFHAVVKKAIVGACRAADEALLESLRARDDQDHLCGSCLAGLLRVGNFAWVINVGDSGVCLAREVPPEEGQTLEMSSGELALIVFGLTRNALRSHGNEAISVGVTIYFKCFALRHIIFLIEPFPDARACTQLQCPCSNPFSLTPIVPMGDELVNAQRHFHPHATHFLDHHCSFLPSPSAPACFAVRCVRLTSEHNTSLSKERSRIQKAGGSVDAEGRVCGRLAVTRAFGDLALKGKGVVSTPEIKRFALSAHDRFLVLACDGELNSKIHCTISINTNRIDPRI